jgi:hypothetical protein
MNLERRIKQLEERVAPKPGPRHVLLTNIPPDEETGYTLEIRRGAWADVLGPPLSEREVEELREKYRREDYR